MPGAREHQLRCQNRIVGGWMAKTIASGCRLESADGRHDLTGRRPLSRLPGAALCRAPMKTFVIVRLPHRQLIMRLFVK